MAKPFFYIVLFLMVTTFSAVDSRPVIPPEMVTKDLVGFWSFDQTTIKGKTVNDIWSKNHGTIKGGPKSVKGKFGEALSFDGKKDLVEIPHHASLRPQKRSHY